MPLHHGSIIASILVHFHMPCTQDIGHTRLRLSPRLPANPAGEGTLSCEMGRRRKQNAACTP